MNQHFEAQSVLESLTWLSQNLSGLDAETAELILVAEGPWSIVLDAAKKQFMPPQPPAPDAPAPAPAVLTQTRAESAPAATPAPAAKPPRKMAGM